MPAIMARFAVSNVAASCLHILRDMSGLHKSPQPALKNRYLLTPQGRACSHPPF
jgi:hypothetical protein